ncbi:MAG: histidine kinase [Coriobacteriales bacterium]|jgi:two-component system sensor histidine kinase LytS|nr:histidine kinase [Coriobacteriales bacterium]
MNRQPTLIEVLLVGVAALLAFVAVFAVLRGGHWAVPSLCAVGITAVALLMLRFSIDPDRLRARQSERMLKLAANTLTHMRKGLNIESAEAVCRLLLPATSANAVAITDCVNILGFSGAEKDSHQVGTPIRTESTKASLHSAEMQVITSREGIGFPDEGTAFQAAIVVPIIPDDEVAGTLKLYYRSAKKIDETEQAVALGLSTLLAMQLGLAELEDQRELAAKMELKALQAQIKPHFLFNTINTIAALIRTDPGQARILLREFATFYRRTLEGTLDSITLEQEYLQTLRYLGFEIARFGADRIALSSDIEKGLETVQVPAFIIQPLVENAVGHGMREDAPLRIEISARTQEGEVIVDIRDDGQGMPKDTLAHMFEPSETHAGIALKNVDDRLRGFFGRQAHLEVQSELGIGTTVSMNLGPVLDLKVETDDQSNNSR